MTNWDLPTYYTKDKHNRLRFKFKNSDHIDRNFSQCYQDMFVLSCLDGKTDGIYLEIGAAHPFISNNTALLEKFGWRGISVEIKPEDVECFNKNRSNFIAEGDATIIDYEELFKEVGFNQTCFDYLQVDCEPPSTTFSALKKIPLHKYKFAVITFEHDFYNHVPENDNYKVRDESRKYLENFGYVLVVNNISVDLHHPFEDWWVHPDLVDKKIIDNMKMLSDNTKKAENYMLL
jgi:hypothetical protein